MKCGQCVDSTERPPVSKQPNVEIFHRSHTKTTATNEAARKGERQDNKYADLTDAYDVTHYTHTGRQTITSRAILSEERRGERERETGDHLLVTGVAE